MSKKVFAGLFALIVALGLFFRFFKLDLRPMHHDEANQAVKFGALLEKGEYTYDYFDHHGPSLYYMTLPLALAFTGKDFADLNEYTLRFLPALFGSGILVLLLLLKGRLGFKSVLFSALFISLSPIMVFFSRFYIQEMLLAFFTLGFIICLWLSLDTKKIHWYITAGFMAGFMFATKETSLILFACLLGSLILLKILPPSRQRGKHTFHSLFSRNILLFLGAAFAVWLLFYSSFFHNMNGLWDSIRSIGVYFKRAGEAGAHAHPWYYYLKMLAFSRYNNGPLWSEALILVSAIIGGASAFTKKAKARHETSFIRLVLFYTLFSTLVFSLISYKTPWNIIPFYLGMLVLAGYGISFLIDLCQRTWLKSAVLSLIFIGILHLGWQCWRANFIYYADVRNPYVFAQTSTDFLNLIRRINRISEVHPEHKNMLIKVIADPYMIWPLPWYLREFKRVGYWTEAEEAGKITGTPVIISSMEQTEHIDPLIRGQYLSEFYGLRNEVLLSVHIRLDLWNRILENRR
jgi:uncharacterized protein (TIGR03663 family)